jgi:Arc/MetJ-type ribon-helix-helix transcriptional regulator
MIRTQIQLTEEQSKMLRRIAIRKKKSVAELIRMSVDELIQKEGEPDNRQLRLKAIQAAGKLSGPADLSINHDDYLAEVYGE